MEAKDFPAKETSWRHWVMLVAMNLAIFSVSLTTTSVMNIADHIGVQLNISLTTLEWVVNAYLLASASFIVFCGRLSDIFGQRTLLILGILLFIVGSVVVAFCIGTASLLSGRTLQGLGGAVIASESLAILKVIFPPEKQDFSVSTWASAAGVGFAVGPIVGGACAYLISWRALFWLLVIIQFITLALFLIAKPINIIRQQDKHMDLAGFVILLFFTVPFVLGLANGNGWGWNNPWVISLLVVGVFSLILLYFFETHQSKPLVHFNFFKHPLFILGCVGLFFNTCLLIGVLYFISHFLEFPLLLNKSSLMTGVLLLPFAIGFLISSLFVSTIHKYIGYRVPLAFSSLCLTTGFLWLCFVDIHSTYLFLWGSFILLGIGIGFNMGTFPGLSILAVSTENTRAAAGMVNMFNYLGGIFSIAISSLFMFLTEHHMLRNGFSNINLTPSSQLLVKVSILEHPLNIISILQRDIPFNLQKQVAVLLQNIAVDGFRTSMIFYVVIGLFLTFICLLLTSLKGKME
jgi:DHA2 family methylenomycin A resistance protein-like MFS transporter